MSKQKGKESFITKRRKEKQFLYSTLDVSFQKLDLPHSEAHSQDFRSKILLKQEIVFRVRRET